MINAFIIKKYAALFAVAFISTICFTIGTMFYNYWVGLGGFFLGSLVSVLLGVQLLKNPFSDMMEGKGILALDISSTGIITPFIVNVASPYVRGIFKGKPVSDTFDRNAVNMMKPPVKSALSTATPIVEGENKGGISVELSEEDYNAGRFALFHYPVLIFNSQIGSFVTKDFLCTMEKDVFANHQILYLNRKVEELTTDIKNFARHVVELLQPVQGLLQSKWFWIILIIGIGILAAIFLPPLIKTIGGGMSPAIEAVSSATDTAAGAIVTK